MFRFKKHKPKTEIISSSQDVTSTKDCKKLILDNVRWEASFFVLIFLLLFRSSSRLVLILMQRVTDGCVETAIKIVIYSLKSRE